MDQKPTQPTNAEWPGAFEAYKLSRDAVRVNVWTIVGLLLLSFVGGFIIDFVFGVLGLPSGLAQLVSYFVSIWVSVAMIVAYLASAEHRQASIGETLKTSLPFFFNYFLLTLLSTLLSFVSILLLVVPFFFVFPRLLLAPYYLFDQKLGPIDALKASWEGSKGHLGKIWGIIGVAFLMCLLVFVLVGIYFLIMYSAILAVLYFYITKHSLQPNETPLSAPVAPVAPPTAPQAPVVNM